MAAPHWLLYTLVLIFGSSTWFSVNGVWLELPLLVTYLPEGWTLPSYLTVIVQVGNIGTLTYWVYRKLQHRNHDAALPYLIGFLLFSACLDQALLLFFWSSTRSILGSPHSVGLLSLFFLLSIVDCLSNVVFMPYMGRFPAKLMTAYFIGMGLSGVVPSMAAIMQGSGQIECVLVNNTNSSEPPVYDQRHIKPRFGVPGFFAFSLSWMVLCLSVFIIINWLKDHMMAVWSENIVDRNDLGTTREESSSDSDNSEVSRPDERDRLFRQRQEDYDTSTEEERVEVLQEPEKSFISPIQFGYLLILNAWLNLLNNGILPSVQSYSSLPYGQGVYHWTNALGTLANPIGCFLVFLGFFGLKSVIWMAIWSLLASFLAIYVLVLGIMSPDPWLRGTTLGAALSLLSWMLSRGIIAYVRTNIASTIRNRCHHAEKSLFWLGIFTQLGSFLGALVMFPLINFTRIFRSADYC